MNNNLRIVLKIIISILIWLGVAYIAFTKSVLPIAPCYCPYGPDVECYCGYELNFKGILGENLILGLLLYFILIPGTLIFLFNRFILRKKSVKNKVILKNNDK